MLCRADEPVAELESSLLSIAGGIAAGRFPGRAYVHMSSSRIRRRAPGRLVSSTTRWMALTDCGSHEASRDSDSTCLGGAAVDDVVERAQIVGTDADALARCLSRGLTVAEALTAYDTQRRPVAERGRHDQPRGRLERVLDLVEARAPGGFDEVDAVATYAEREAIVR